MAFPNTLFPLIPLHTEVSDEEYKLFHTIELMLVQKLISSLNLNSGHAIDAVSFLLWLERDKLSANPVHKVLVEWPNHLIHMLADQVVGLLEWLKNPVVVWERRGDISLIQELCGEAVDFIYLHQRRLVILEEKNKIAGEMVDRAFRETFPRGHEDNNVQDGVGFGIGGRVDVQNVGGGLAELSNGNHIEIEFGSLGGYLHGPQPLEGNDGVETAARQLQNNNLGGAGFEVNGRYIHDPRRIMNENHYGVGYGSASRLGNDRLVYDSRVLQNIEVRFAAGSAVHVPQPVRPVFPVPLQYAMNQNFIRFGTVGEIVLGYQEPENLNEGGLRGFGVIGGLVQAQPEPDNVNGGGGDGGYADEPSLNNGQIIPNVPYGPRMGYVDTNGQMQRPDQVNTRRPIPESELSVLLRGLNIKDEETDVREDDRTVFLTFSRGYPITEPEIWGFFTRRFGNFIKGIHFEEVEEGVQPLYARMVARNSSILPLICDVNIRTKYVINGKHVWAKKYVRKNNATPPSRMSSSASTSQQQDPET